MCGGEAPVYARAEPVIAAYARACTLMGDPDLIMVDEPTEGLAPRLVELLRGFLEKIAASGVSILLVEQKLTIALAISNRLYVMGHGRIVFEGTPAELREHEEVRREWLEV